MSAAVVALVAALDGVKTLDACSREEKIAAARKILDRCPTLLPVEIADRIGRASPKLAAKLEREQMPNGRRLGYLGAIVCNTDEPPPKTPRQEADDRSQAEKEFSRHELREMRACRMEAIGHLTPAQRDARERRIDAIEDWRRTRFTSSPSPTPHWALQGADSPEDYAARVAPKKRSAPSSIRF